MAKLSLPQLRGAKDLIQEAVEAGVTATEQLHLAIARKPYVLLARIDAIAGPVQAVDLIQQTITGSVYRAIRVANRLTGAIATKMIDRLDVTEDRTGKFW
jgi:hypothetical protein